MARIYNRADQRLHFSKALVLLTRDSQTRIAPDGRSVKGEVGGWGRETTGFWVSIPAPHVSVKGTGEVARVDRFLSQLTIYGLAEILILGSSSIRV